jgi:hypothetical protein
MLAEIAISATTRQEIADSLRLIAEEIEREHPSVNHWGGHHGRPGSYRVNLSDAAVRDDDPGTDALDLADVMRRLVEMTDMEGGIRPWAEARGLHASIIDHFLRGQRGPSPQLLKALGLSKVTTYRIESCSDE